MVHVRKGEVCGIIRLEKINIMLKHSMDAIIIFYTFFITCSVAMYGLGENPSPFPTPRPLEPRSAAKIALIHAEIDRLDEVPKNGNEVTDVRSIDPWIMEFIKSFIETK